MQEDQILLVEGNDDFHVLINIFKEQKVPENFTIKDSGGIDNLLGNLPANVRSDYSAIGIVVDADSDLKKIWNKLKKICTKFNYTFPKSPDPVGTIIENDEFPTLGIWIMPDNNASGMLEDFVKVLIPDDDKLLPVVNKTLDRVESKELNKYKPIHRQKAEVHTWLAWQKDPGTPMGAAVSKKYLETDKELCNTFVKWIEKLFINPASSC